MANFTTRCNATITVDAISLQNHISSTNPHPGVMVRVEDLDTEILEHSSNPVRNSVIYAALQAKAPASVFSTSNDNTYAIVALPTQMQGAVTINGELKVVINQETTNVVQMLKNHEARITALENK